MKIHISTKDILNLNVTIPFINMMLEAKQKMLATQASGGDENLLYVNIENQLGVDIGFCYKRSDSSMSNTVQSAESKMPNTTISASNLFASRKANRKTTVLRYFEQSSIPLLSSRLSVVRAWYGDLQNLWAPDSGMDVTELVRVVFKPIYSLFFDYL